MENNKELESIDEMENIKPVPEPEFVPKNLDSCIPFPLDEKTLNDIVGKAKDWAIMHGAAMRSRDDFSEDSLQVISTQLYHE